MYPNLFGDIPVYFVMALVGFAAAFMLAYFRRKAYEYRIIDLISMLCASVVGIIVGSKLLFVITEIPALIQHNFSWEIINKRVINSGLVFYGGLIGALFCIYLLAKYTKSDASKMLNFFSPCCSAFHIFGRIGCLLEGCCYGIESSVGLPMPQFYADGSVKYINRIPVQLYEAIILVLITVILVGYEVYSQKKQRPFNILPLYIALYAPARFVLEYLRGDILRGVFEIKLNYSTTDGSFAGVFTLSTSQIISLILIAALLIYLGYRGALARHDKRAGRHTDELQSVTELKADELPQAESLSTAGPQDENTEN